MMPKSELNTWPVKSKIKLVAPSIQFNMLDKTFVVRSLILV